jgi:hypothetical protein
MPYYLFSWGFPAKILYAFLISSMCAPCSTHHIFLDLITLTYAESHKIINSIWNKEKLPQQSKEYVILPVYGKGDKTDCSHYSGTSLPTTYKILFNILLSWLTPYVDKFISHNKCEFWCNRSVTDYIFYIHQILEKNGSIMGQCISYRFWEGPWLSQERSIVQESHWILYTCETC